jgi:hypothetical protein
LACGSFAGVFFGKGAYLIVFGQIGYNFYMGLVKRSWGIWVIIGVLLLGAYLFTRLFNLTLFPVFTDEAIYIRWSQIGSRDASWRFISLVDGKQPLFTWIMMVLMRFITDPLVAGRLVSVIAGAASMIGIWFLGNEVFKNKRIALISSMLYLISPFTLMYDKLALYDSLVATFSIWSLYLAILLIRTLRTDVALVFGMVLGAGMLNKTSAFLSLYMLPFTLVLFDWKKKGRTNRLLLWGGLAVIAAGLSQAIYSILRLSPLFAMIGLKDTVFVYTLKEWLTHPFHFLVGNMHGLLDWNIHYLTWPVFLVALVPLLFFRKNIREKLLLYVWWAAPMVALALFGKVLYPRFVLFMSMPLLILAADGIYEIITRIKSKYIVAAICTVLCFQSIITDYHLLTDPVKAAIPLSDKGQMLNDWPAGGGAKEVVQFLRIEAEKGPLAVYTEGTFGLFPYAIEMYLVDNKNVEIHGFWPMTVTIPDEIKATALVKPTYFVTNLTQTQPNWPLTLIAAYQKGSNVNSSMRLYKVVLPKEK